MTWHFSWEHGWKSLWKPEFLNRWSSAFKPGSRARVSPFMHPAVLRAWAEASELDERDIRVIRASHTDGREVNFVMTRQPGSFPGQYARVLSAIGGPRFDFSDPLIFPSAEGKNVIDEEFWRTFESEMWGRDHVNFDRIEFPRLRGETLGGYIPDDDEPDVSPFLEITQFTSMDGYMEHCNGRRRRNLRRRLKVCSEAGDFSFEVLGKDQIDRVLSWIPRIVEQKRTKFNEDESLDEFEIFVTKLVREAMPTGHLVCSCCTLDGRDISWSIDFLVGDELLQYVADFDPEFRNLSPGTVHTYHLLEWSIANKVRYFNFMWGNEDYKREWTEGEAQKLYRIRFDRQGPASRLRLLADRARSRLLRSRDKPPLERVTDLVVSLVAARGDRHLHHLRFARQLSRL